MERNEWARYTITAVIGAIMGIIATHGQHGQQIATVQARLDAMERVLTRIERALMP